MTRRAPWPDERLIKAAQDGDVPSLTTVVMQSQPHVRKFALSLRVSPQDAKDAAQEALIILYRKICSLRVTGALASWMFRIVRNECLRQIRLLVSRSDETAAESEASAEQSAEEVVLRRLQVEGIATAISALPRDQRHVLVMRDVQGLPGSVVARSLGLSNTAMKSSAAQSPCSTASLADTRRSSRRESKRSISREGSMTVNTVKVTKSTNASATPESTGTGLSFASKSVPRHLARGVIGFGLITGSIGLIPIVGSIALLGAPLGLIAFRGCPTCWMVGPAQTISQGRLERKCVDGICTLAKWGRGDEGRERVAKRDSW